MSAAKRQRAAFDAHALSVRYAANVARAERVAREGEEERATEIRERALATVLREADKVIEEARKEGADTPTLERAVKASYRVTLAPTPWDSAAPPAWVVRFDGNGPVMRLANTDPPALDQLHLSAARRLAALHHEALSPPAVTASYEGPRAGGRAEARSERRCDAWDEMRDGLRTLLPVEARVVLAVVVWETPIAHLVRGRLVPMAKSVRSEAALVQTLRLGLERLALRWSLTA